ncbi:c-type cytochrome [Spiribacter halobius]|uniref:Cytochrome C n=1 Tax=Sediminicurvatus halobius TaxID=2182432 RepID=A0A2U2N4S9_9GAMM|nr:c-type cytochrome [Spiribacter halobius]PWG64038.1 cytochrome C [Spiribacter halobius]UEX76907.1 c-type cytochrome [Spiribacter halobius]
MMKPLIPMTVAVLALGMAQAHAQDVSAGEKIYSQACVTCHGPSGQGLASFPALQGRDAEYITMRLEQYRAGERVGANSALMAPNAANLSDEDIAALADYISTNFQ